MRTLRHLVAVLVASLVLLPLANRAGAEEAAEAPEAPRRPMLWVLEGEAPVYLFGTIHLPDPRVTDLLDVVEKAFDASDVFYAEIEMDAGGMAALQPLMMLPEEKDLASILGEELWERATGAMAGQGLPDVVLGRFKPWVLSMLLLQKAMTPQEKDDDIGEEGAEEGDTGESDEAEAHPEPMDAVLYRTAATHGKITDGLETPKEQVDVFDSLSEAEQVEMLEGILDVIEDDGEDDGEDASGEEAASGGGGYADQYEALVRLYRTGDVDGMDRLIREQTAQGGETLARFMKKLFDDRNVTMTDRILEARTKHAGKTLFVAVGAGHYAGEGGIVALLRAGGHTVRRLEADAELPTPVAAGK